MARKSDTAPNKLAPPSDDSALIAWANERLEKGSRIDEFTAKQNLAFMLGNQWSTWDAKNNRFRNEQVNRGDPNAPVRVTVNKIGTHVERIVARLTKDMPIPEVRPASDSVADINAARVSTRILTHELERLDWHLKLMELYFWVMPLGWSFWHMRWDPSQGPQVATTEDGDPLHQGEIVIEEVPAFEMRVDPNASRWHEARWCIRTSAMTKEAVYEQYGIYPENEGGDTTVNEWRLDRTPYSNSTAHNTGVTSNRANGDFVAVHQMWIRPGSRAVPNGAVFTWTGSQILEEKQDFPYEHGLLPYEPLSLLPAVGGSPEGRTWVTDLVPLQKDYNDSRSREAMIRRTLTPKILAAAGQIDPNRLTSRVEVVTYNPTGPQPNLLLPDSRWATQFQQGMERADQEIGDRSGQQDVSQGRAASSAAAATVIALQEADETKLAISGTELRSFVERVGYQMLNLVKQFWDEGRTIRTWSRDGKMEVDDFTKSDIANRLDVHVSSESALPRSKSARTQLAIDLWGQGILGSDPQLFVRLLDLPGTDFLLETLSIDKKQAEREHGYLLEGVPVEVKTWENHEAHYAAHQELRKTEQYEQAPPEVQAAIDAHADTHFAIIAQKAAMGMGSLPGGMGMPPGSVDNILGNTGAPGNSGANGQPTDPNTGLPQDPNMVAGGLSPTAQTAASGEPGSVPFLPVDQTQAALGN